MILLLLFAPLHNLPIRLFLLVQLHLLPLLHLFPATVHITHHNSRQQLSAAVRYFDLNTMKAREPNPSKKTAHKKDLAEYDSQFSHNFNEVCL
jgi:hypothetical protein